MILFPEYLKLSDTLGDSSSGFKYRYTHDISPHCAAGRTRALTLTSLTDTENSQVHCTGLVSSAT